MPTVGAEIGVVLADQLELQAPLSPSISLGVACILAGGQRRLSFILHVLTLWRFAATWVGFVRLFQGLALHRQTVTGSLHLVC